MNFKKELEQRTEHAEAVIRNYLPKEEGFQKTVLAAMNYSILAGGKRLRPILMEESFRLFGGEGDVIYPFMCAIEMIHNYSLVHDDLPAMDNDEYRRGKKTTWAVYGDGMAVLAGDGLLNLAFETASGAFTYAKDMETAGRIAKAIQILGAKSGVYGMIGGQTADIEAESGREAMTEELLLYIHAHKTAALIQASFMIGAVLAGAAPEAVSQMEKAAYNVGVAFQIQDDILDVAGKAEVLGKPIGSDAKNNKLTYVSLNGMEAAKNEVEKLSREAIEILRSFSGQDEFLPALVTSLINREK